jgi:enoyl-CoA hydratase
MPSVTVEIADAVGLIGLDDPASRNALSNEVLGELAGTLAAFDADPQVRCAVIAGSDRVFASGADLRALAALDGFSYARERAPLWERIRRVRLPVVAAVSGHCLGGGCELALMSDIVIASETAQFGLPETSLGLIPGAGGTQRLVRAVGKATAMDVILAGRLLSAADAHAAGLVARVTAPDRWLEEARAVAATIAARSVTAIELAKRSVNAAFETPLDAGLDLERKAFAVALDSAEARAGIAAFLERRARQSPTPPG